MNDGPYYPGEWEVVNFEMSRMELPDGWLIITRVQYIVGGEVFHTASNPLLYHDPKKNWRIKTK